ncbi:unnamed protein product [Symbiodinium sp. CCMP2456]|nr:unnamed protein product [Symbiodinium sp. CCMP2456]
MQDLSSSSGTWWKQVVDLVQSTYTLWLAASPLERLQLEPKDHENLTTGKWTRVNARACSLILQSLTEQVRLDLISRRVVQSSPLVLFRLHTTYQPGGASERSTVLGNLQTTTTPATLEEALVWLRAWPRWVQRCKDLKMMVPDGSVLSKVLTGTTAKFIGENPDAQFRTQLLRSSLRIDAQPTQADVCRYQKHLQAEIETMVAAKTTNNTLLAKEAVVEAPSVLTATTCRICPNRTSKGGQKGSTGNPGSQQQTSSSTSRDPKVQRMEPEGETSPTAQATSVVSGEPVWTLEALLQAAAKVAGAKPPEGPSINVISLRAHQPMSGTQQTFALIGSGATHALRRAKSQEEWSQAAPVIVNLAGGESVYLRMNAAGTILVPASTMSTTSSTTPIVPLGALVGQLGYTMTWNSSRCKLEGRDEEVYNLRVREGCPEIAEHDALNLIARLEDENLEALKINTSATRRRVKAAAVAMNRTWFDYLSSYVDSGLASQALAAADAAPFFQDVPKECLTGLVEAMPEANGWDSLKGLEHLNRRTRKKLWGSNKWVLHLFAGNKEKRDLYHLEKHGYAVLELGVERGRTHDILRQSTWKALEYAARKGKIAAIVGGPPPQGSFMISRHVVGGPSPLRSNDYPYGNWHGQSEADVYEVNKQTQLLVRMVYLHALSTAGRIKSQPDPDPLYPDVVSFWRTPMWTEYALDQLKMTGKQKNHLDRLGAKQIEEDGQAEEVAEVQPCVMSGNRTAIQSFQTDKPYTTSNAMQTPPQSSVRQEDWTDWEMFLVLQPGATGTVLLDADVLAEPWLRKAEVVYSDNVEQLLESLEAPLNIVHTVNPREVSGCVDRWVPALRKEIASLEHAVDKVMSDEEDVQQDLATGRGQMIPMKVVFTVKPPDVPAEGEQPLELYKRKARIVVCGNMASHQPGEVYTNTTPAEVVRAAIALARFFNWDFGMIDVVAAFLQTPLKELQDAPLVYGIPPKLLVKIGLCRPGELWRLTHAVYGLQESPKLWGSYRDIRLARIQLVFEGKRVTLMQGRVEPSWWSVLQEGSVLIGVLVVYVDDILICGKSEMIRELAKVIRDTWKTSELQLVSDGTIRFLGIEISKCTQGYALSQRSYIEELVRLHNVPPTRKDIIPISKDLANFNIEDHESVYTDGELKAAQQCAGELLWVSQRARPDLCYVASLVGSLSTRAPRRAVQIAEKAIAFLQRTIGHSLVYQGDSSGLVAYCDASFAPEGGRSHSGWLIMLNDCVIAWRSGRQSTITLSTAESELTAISEAVLALQSSNAMMSDMMPGGLPLQLFSDSTAALAIANGSGSWRTRHLRLRSAWVAELIASQAVTVHHCVGEVQPADLLTKALSSQRIRTLSRLINLRGSDEDYDESAAAAVSTENSRSINISSCRARAPNHVPKGLIGLLILSQAVMGESYNWEEGEAMVVKTELQVNYGVITWAFMWAAVIVFLLAWELLKWLVWLAYDRATPGSTSRRVKKLQKLREATTAAIQREIQVRTGGRLEQRARDAAVSPLVQKGAPPRSGTQSSSTEEIKPALPEDPATERMKLLRRLASGTKEQGDVGCQAGVFTPAAPPETRVILRYVHEPPGETFYIPGNECFHVYGDCHAFRHRGTADKVERRRLCQYCLNRAGDDPDKHANYGADLERAREYERIFNTQLQQSGQSVRG